MNIPSGFGVKSLLEDKLTRHQASKKLNLKTLMTKAIIDHTILCPEIFGNAMQPKITKRGFIENGMIHDKVETYPDIIKMMRTCKLKDFQQEHGDTIINIFSDLYQEMKEKGQILEKTFERLKFSRDTG